MHLKQQKVSLSTFINSVHENRHREIKCLLVRYLAIFYTHSYTSGFLFFNITPQEVKRQICRGTPEGRIVTGPRGIMRTIIRRESARRRLFPWTEPISRTIGKTARRTIRRHSRTRMRKNFGCRRTMGWQNGDWTDQCPSRYGARN